MSANPSSNSEDDVPIPSFLDPNVGQNRVPTDSELLGLKTLVESNSRVARILDEEIKQLRESYDAIHTRYIAQERELEATQSQLHKAKDILAAMKKQRAFLQLQQDNLSALMHPIRRCPEDILTNIFQLVVEMSQDDLHIQRSICLSSVCKRWRFIVVDNPKLWATISIDLARPHESLDYLRIHVFPRVKHMPAHVTVRSVNVRTAPTLAICGIRGISKIHQLRLDLSTTTSKDVCILLGTGFPPLTTVVHSLVLSSRSSPSDPRTPASLNIMRAITRFPSIEELSITRIFKLRFQGEHANVRSLVLSEVLEVNILDVLRSFPKLELLDISQADLKVDGNPPVLLVPSVREIVLALTNGLSWMSHVSFTRLQGLSYTGDYSEDLINFISAHRSLTTLDCHLGGNITGALATAAPNLKVLRISPPSMAIICVDAENSLEPPFPLLRSLVIVTGRDVPLTLTEFDTLVSTRCLPMRHPKGQAKSPSHIISGIAIVTSDTTSTPEWHESELYKSSTRNFDNYDARTVHLTWPSWG